MQVGLYFDSWALGILQESKRLTALQVLQHLGAFFCLLFNALDS